MANQEPVILYCNCSYSPVIQEEVKETVRGVLSNLAPDGVHAVSDLCKLAVRSDAGLKALARDKALVVIACHRRAVECLLAAGGISLDGREIQFINMRNEPAQVESELKKICQAFKTSARAGNHEIDIKKDGDWIPWFPVIDYELCKHCGQCHNFCLFNVFGVSEEGKIEVVNPANCKTNCPACARVCPYGAIIFPKYPNGPINGGPDEEDAGQIDLSGISKVDIYSMLRERSRLTEMPIANSKDIQKAMQERTKCSCRQNNEQVPDEVSSASDAQTVSSDCACDCNCNSAAEPECDCDCDCYDDVESACDCSCDCDNSEGTDSHGDEDIKEG
ncbi:MAG: ferredoxin family protein [Sedimentisphaerales bacterium]|nr:ferredoxin family protein [Sedimentisphaerales bacterium]